ncbi:MRP family ATP-binding protein [Helicobacter sp. MIT 03-1614]|uniref:Mrp/NBP35 family ATP-binding protein n=1 Tax=Helicobacter sp. MIT 03-1614 TaxID=1548147 RepID=UPI000513CDDF|nr:Mrp/NBP35 family ATP-binding protein [Helicobacter sp. MIT 03-1614]TLD89026.1 MRP family ATP-binding protein [Helicobacter sp. MIT 03-1614]
MPQNQKQITEILSSVIYPNFSKDIVSFGFLKEVKVGDNEVRVRIDIPSSSQEIIEKLRQEISQKLESVLQGATLHLEINSPKPAPQPQPKTKNLAPHIKHFVMVSSGKGGVGKSTSSVNLAIALAQQGKKVGLLDADIYGPNIPRMLGLNANKAQVDESQKKLIPLKAFGVEMMSMGVLYDEGQSLIWRGPMIMRAIEQMLTDVIWSNLDVLVIDMPPGTGDAQLTLAQSVPVSAGVIVTTPQKVSLDDSARSLDMFDKLKVPIAGIIENMSGFICPDCGKEYDIFGKGTSEVLANEYSTHILAQVPLEPKVREGGDSGKPIAFFEPDSQSAKAYMQAAAKILNFLEKVSSQNLADNKDIQPTQHKH